MANEGEISVPPPDVRPKTIWTIGHSTHSYDTFLDLLVSNRIEAIADVRSRPFSGYNPHFNKERIRNELEVNGIRYVHLGRQLGAHREEDAVMQDSTCDFTEIASSSLFQSGLHRLIHGAGKYRIAMMCGEKDPLTCHRTHLVERALRSFAPNVQVEHINSDGTLETTTEFESRLMQANDVDETDLFMSREELVMEAYRRADR